VQAIVTAAEQLLVEVGYGRTSTNAIAARAGVSVGSVYQYFGDKEAIFREVVARHVAEVQPLVRAAIERMQDAAHDPVEVALDVMREMAAVNARNPPLMAAIERDLGWLEHHADDDLDVTGTLRGILRRRFELTAREGAVAAELMVLTTSYLSRWLVHGKPPSLDAELFIAATGRMLRAILPTR
jgi:AcrR family transcriptional regulator